VSAVFVLGLAVWAINCAWLGLLLGMAMPEKNA